MFSLPKLYVAPCTQKIVLTKFDKELVPKVKSKSIVIRYAHYFLTLTSGSELLIRDKTALQQVEKTPLSMGARRLGTESTRESLPPRKHCALTVI